MTGTQQPAARENEITLPFSDEEYRARRERVLSAMEERGIDLLLVSSRPNYYYLTGLRAGVTVTEYLFVFALTKGGDGLWVGRRTEMSNVRALADVSWTREGAAIDDSVEPYGALAKAIVDIAGASATIGVELASAVPTPAGLETMKRVASGLHIVDSSGLIEQMRAVKSPAELDYMRAAGSISGSAIERAIGSLRSGMTDSALAANLIGEAIRLGSEPMSLGPFVSTGRRSYLAHSSWLNVPIREGDLINTEIAAVVARYNAPVFRVSVLGRPSDEVRRFHDASLAGLRAGLEHIKPAMTSHQADKVVRDAIDKAGFGEYFPVRAAYSIGIGLPPTWSENNAMSIRPGDERVLTPGMCFHLVPALYKRDLGAVCCSYPICITDAGVEPLTDIPAELFVVD